MKTCYWESTGTLRWTACLKTARRRGPLTVHLFSLTLKRWWVRPKLFISPLAKWRVHLIDSQQNSVSNARCKKREPGGGEIKSAPSLCSLSDSPLATVACRDSLTCLKCSRALSHKSVQIHVNLRQNSFTRTSSKPEPVCPSRSPAPERGRYKDAGNPLLCGDSRTTWRDLNLRKTGWFFCLWVQGRAFWAD